jgi:large subunit ribosomal protein L25
MEPIIIEVTKDQYATSKEARKNGRVPIVYYSKDVQPTNFSADYQDFRRAFRKAGRSAIMTLVDENKEEYSALAHEIQYHPVTDEMIHVDLMAIKKGQKITTEIPIVFTGESPAVREMAGIFVTNKDKVAIECLPKDLPSKIEVDVSGLVDFHSSLTVGDLTVPEEITVLDAPEISIATVTAPRMEEEPVVAEGEEGEAEGEEGEAVAEGEEKEGEAKPEGEEKKEEKGAEATE